MPQSPQQAVDPLELARQMGATVAPVAAGGKSAGKSDPIALAKQMGATVKPKRPGEPRTPWTPPAYEIPGPSAILTGLKETMVPAERVSDIWQGPWQAIRHPIESAKLVGGNIVAAHAEQIRQGLVEFRQATTAGKGKTPAETMALAQSSFGHFLAAAVPVIGPAAANAAENLKHPETFWRGVGDTIGLLLPFGIGEVGKRVRPVKETGPVPLTRPERTGGTVSRYAEDILERSLPGAGTFKGFRVGQQTALIDRMAEGIVTSISSFKGTSTDLVDRIRAVMGQTQKQLEGQANTLYREIDQETQPQVQRVPTTVETPSKLVDAKGQPMTYQRRTLVKQEVGGVQPETVAIKRIAVEMLRRLKAEEKVIGKTLLADYKKQLEGIIRGPKQASFQAFQDARSDLLNVVRRYDEAIPGKSAGLAKRLAKTTDEALTKAAREYDQGKGMTAEDAGSLESRVRRANAIWSDLKFEFNESLVKKLLDQDPTKIPALIKATPIEDLRYLKTHLPAETWRDLTAHILRDTLNESITNAPVQQPGGLNTAIGIAAGAYGSAAERLNLPELHFMSRRALPGGNWSKQMAAYGERAAVLFTPETFTRIGEVEEIARRISDKGSVPTIFTAGLNAMLIWRTAHGIATGDWRALAQTGGVAGGTWLAAKIITHPEGIRAFRSFARAVSSANVEQAQYWGMRINQLAGSQPQSATPSPTK